MSSDVSDPQPSNEPADDSKTRVTENEILSGAHQAMGEQLGTEYFHLRTQVLWLHAKWSEYKELFDPNEVEFLNRTAGVFFADVQRLMMSDILIHLCRVTDDATGNSRPNLTIRGLPLSVDQSEPHFMPLWRSINVAVAAADYARTWRNRWLAHSDLELTTGGASNPLPSANAQGIENTLQKLSECLNLLASAYAPIRSWI